MLTDVLPNERPYCGVCKRELAIYTFTGPGAWRLTVCALRAGDILCKMRYATQIKGLRKVLIFGHPHSSKMEKKENTTFFYVY